MPTKKWSCDKCDREFQNERGLQVHKARGHKSKAAKDAAKVAKASKTGRVRFCPCCGLNLERLRAVENML